jgi:hypothetical protein
MPVRTAARITLFIPGASPPLVRIAIRFNLHPPEADMLVSWMRSKPTIGCLAKDPRENQSILV